MSHDDIILERFAQDLIRRKVRRLIGRAGFTERDREDLEQELRLRLFQSLRLFDPTQAHHHVYVTTVVERQAAMILRDRSALKQGGGAVRSLDQEQTADGNAFEPMDPRPSDQEKLDLRKDVAEVIAGLPEDLQVLAEQLKTMSLSQVARGAGKWRSTLQRRVNRLREHFEDAGLRIYL